MWSHPQGDGAIRQYRKALPGWKILAGKRNRVNGVERKSLKSQVLSPGLIQQESKDTRIPRESAGELGWDASGSPSSYRAKEGARGQQAEDRMMGK